MQIFVAISSIEIQKGITVSHLYAVRPFCNSTDEIFKHCVHAHAVHFYTMLNYTHTFAIKIYATSLQLSTELHIYQPPVTGLAM
jgi:hypothetical protein